MVRNRRRLHAECSRSWRARQSCLLRTWATDETRCIRLLARIDASQYIAIVLSRKTREMRSTRARQFSAQHRSASRRLSRNIVSLYSVTKLITKYTQKAPRSKCSSELVVAQGLAALSPPKYVWPPIRQYSLLLSFQSKSSSVARRRAIASNAVPPVAKATGSSPP